VIKLKPTVIYEENFQIELNKAFDLTLQWLNSQHKAKIKQSSRPTFIDAKQGTMMTNTGHDPNWKKRVRINFYNLEGNQILIRIEAIPISRSIFRVEKLKYSWYEGLFSHLFSLLKSFEKKSEPEIILSSDIRYCGYCGKKVDSEAEICPFCGSELK
jgi:hypothetical protein